MRSEPEALCTIHSTSFHMLRPAFGCRWASWFRRMHVRPRITMLMLMCFLFQSLWSLVAENISNKLAWPEFYEDFCWGQLSLKSAWAFLRPSPPHRGILKEATTLGYDISGKKCDDIWKAWAIMGNNSVSYGWMMMSDIWVCLVWQFNWKKTVFWLKNLIWFDTCNTPLIGVIAYIILGIPNWGKVLPARHGKVDGLMQWELCGNWNGRPGRCCLCQK